MARTRKGKKMTKTGRYDIVATEGRPRKFRGTLLKTFNIGKMRLAVFSVPKLKKRKSN